MEIEAEKERGRNKDTEIEWETGRHTKTKKGDNVYTVQNENKSKC